MWYIVKRIMNDYISFKYSVQNIKSILKIVDPFYVILWILFFTGLPKSVSIYFSRAHAAAQDEPYQTWGV